MPRAFIPGGKIPFRDEQLPPTQYRSYPPSFRFSHNCNPSYKAHRRLPRRRNNVAMPAWQPTICLSETKTCRVETRTVLIGLGRLL